jgi:hypothetical protein
MLVMTRTLIPTSSTIILDNLQYVVALRVRYYYYIDVRMHTP